jgi:hypothetical protein
VVLIRRAPSGDGAFREDYVARLNISDALIPHTMILNMQAMQEQKAMLLAMQELEQNVPNDDV